MEMSRLSRWALSLLMLRVFSWGQWRRCGRCRKPKSSRADTFTRSAGTAALDIPTVLAIIYLMLFIVFGDLALGHFYVAGWYIVLVGGYLASTVSRWFVSLCSLMSKEISSECNGLTALAPALLLLLSLLAALLLVYQLASKNLSLLSVGRRLNSFTLLRPDSPSGHVICCFATLALHLTHQIGLRLALVSYNCFGLGATLWPMYVPFMTSACWALCSGLGRILSSDFVENFTGPSQEFALLSLGVSALHLYFLLGWSRVLCSWVLLSSPEKACLDDSHNIMNSPAYTTGERACNPISH
jgi:hypothetical protein